MMAEGSIGYSNLWVEAGPMLFGSAAEPSNVGRHVHALVFILMDAYELRVQPSQRTTGYASRYHGGPNAELRCTHALFSRLNGFTTSTCISGFASAEHCPPASCHLSISWRCGTVSGCLQHHGWSLGTRQRIAIQFFENGHQTSFSTRSAGPTRHRGENRCSPSRKRPQLGPILPHQYLHQRRGAWRILRWLMACIWRHFNPFHKKQI